MHLLIFVLGAFELGLIESEQVAALPADSDQAGEYALLFGQSGRIRDASFG